MFETGTHLAMSAVGLTRFARLRAAQLLAQRSRDKVTDRPTYLVTICLFTAAFATGCGREVIPNTYVEDTKENREILEYVDSYRKAVESRDMGSLLALASLDYYDDMGTPRGDDDIDYDTLKEGLVRLRNDILDARYQISYRGVSYVGNRILVDVLYTGWFRVETPEGPQWRRRLEPHRLVLVREDDDLKIVSGM
jgi:hypothetical protein